MTAGAADPFSAAQMEVIAEDQFLRRDFHHSRQAFDVIVGCKQENSVIVGLLQARHVQIRVVRAGRVQGSGRWSSGSRVGRVQGSGNRVGLLQRRSCRGLLQQLRQRLKLQTKAPALTPVATPAARRETAGGSHHRRPFPDQRSHECRPGPQPTGSDSLPERIPLLWSK